MKKLVALLLIGLGGAGALLNWIKVEAGPKPDEPGGQVWFSAGLSLADLTGIKLQVLSRGLALHYHQLEFDDAGGLVYLDFSVKEGDQSPLRRQSDLKKEGPLAIFFTPDSQTSQSFYIGREA